MDIRSKYALELQDIANDLEILKNGFIYEIQNTPGIPKCSTVGTRLEKKLNKLLYTIEHNMPGEIEIAAEIISRDCSTEE